MLEFKEKVYKANLELVQRHLALCSWGNVSSVCRERGIVVIKPHNISFEDLRPGDMVVLDLDGNVIDGKGIPSIDAPTHLVLYKKFPEIGAIVHSHSTMATSWAQSGKSIPVLGTTHADCFCGNIPCTRTLNDVEIDGNYEETTGNLIVETFKELDPMKISGVLVNGHGPMVWGKDVESALKNATVLEEVAKMALNTLQINPSAPLISQKIINKHFERGMKRGQ